MVLPHELGSPQANPLGLPPGCTSVISVFPSCFCSSEPSSSLVSNYCTSLTLLELLLQPVAVGTVSSVDSVYTALTLACGPDSLSWPASLSSRGSQPPLQSHTGPQPPLLEARTEPPATCHAGLSLAPDPLRRSPFCPELTPPSYPFTLALHGPLVPVHQVSDGGSLPTDAPDTP